MTSFVRKYEEYCKAGNSCTKITVLHEKDGSSDKSLQKGNASKKSVRIEVECVDTSGDPSQKGGKADESVCIDP
jgi:hypothetical protein